MIRRVLLILAVAVLGAAAALYVPHRLYWQRYFAVAAKGGSGDVDVYAPTEPVAGAPFTPLPVAGEAERTIPAAALDAAVAYAGQNASTSLLIWRRGRLERSAYWGGVGPETRINSRSLHKMLGALVIAAAIQKGFIGSVDDPVARYITEWRGTRKEAMTIRHVLTMSSGLMWFGSRGGPFGLGSRRYLDPEWERIIVQDIPLEFTPGSAYDYSDITADLMPIIVSRATHQRYVEFLSDAVLKPIGAAGGEIWIDRPGGMPHGGCCLMLPPESWLRVGLLVLSRGRVGETQVLPPGWTDAMIRPSPNNRHFGLMVWLGEPYAQRRLYHRPTSAGNRQPRPGAFQGEPFRADDVVMFDGMNGQIVYLIPSQELVIVRTGLRPLREKPEWDYARLPNLILAALGVPARGNDVRSAPRPPARAPDPSERVKEEGRFWRRWMTIRGQTPRSTPGWIDTPDTIAGPGDAWPGESVNGRDLGPGGLKRAVEYAATMRSLSLLVWRKGRLQHEQYWEGFGPNDRSETYSMAKSIVGLATGLAIADGRIGSVDDAAAKYLAEWRGTAKEAITVRDLLTMSSGLAFWPVNYSTWQSPWNPRLRALFGPDMVEAALGFPSVDVPGARFGYNSLNTEILLAVIERATGERYASYVSRRLWQPLGAAPAQLWLDRPGGTPRGFAYFHARPRDWLRLGVMIAREGTFEGREIVPPEWIRRMTTPSEKNPNYGYQVWLGAPASGKRFYNPASPAFVTHSAPYLAPDVVFFDGGGGHRVYVIPSRDLVVVRTGAVNRPDWDDAVIPNALLADLP